MSATVFWPFESARDAVAAAVRLRALGYQKLEAHTPCEVPELEPILRIGRTRIPVVALAAAIVGLLVAYGIIWFTNAVDFPIDSGGRPLDSFPADVPILFETAVLFSAIAIFVSTLVRSGLPRLHRPLFELEEFDRAAIDRYWIGIDHRELDRDALDHACAALAVRMIRVPEPPP